ncbi:unnamed protein product [Rodentolepis nana]|uniref:Lipoyl-binding domain-containing protein n=1 Tax=Rodentolepis nana TaxID=102285 RepID=A0A0R3T7T9_RODNA|nr:unnamed protein product [Rodentolepis nana]
MFVRGIALLPLVPKFCNRLLNTHARVMCPMKIGMPNLSPTMEQGKILKWTKREGETIEAGDIICQVQTDKAVMDMEFEEEGVLAKIVQHEGSESKVGEIIAILAEPDEDWQEVNKNADAFIASLK